MLSIDSVLFSLRVVGNRKKNANAHIHTRIGSMWTKQSQSGAVLKRYQYRYGGCVLVVLVILVFVISIFYSMLSNYLVWNLWIPTLIRDRVNWKIFYTIKLSSALLPCTYTHMWIRLNDKLFDRPQMGGKCNIFNGIQ